MKTSIVIRLLLVIVCLITVAVSFRFLSFDDASLPYSISDDSGNATTVDVAEHTFGQASERQSLGFGLDPEVLGVELTAEVAELKVVFDQSLPLADSFERMAVEGRWTYDDSIQNLILWQFLCDAGDHRLSQLVDEPGNSEMLQKRVGRLCDGFAEKQQEMDDLTDVEGEERLEGINRRAALENSLSELGPDLATRAAIAELSRALDVADYAGALGAVWFLGVFQFDGASPEWVVYTRQPNVETIFAVTSSIFCSAIGGCDGTHPVTLNLCLMFPWLPCGQAPDSIYHAIDQILTGSELETFNEMNASLIRMLNRYRAGNL
ncbi:MAG: hypothetical protein ACXIUL_13525 [Wenzhouxiangella sp.]